MAVLRILNLTVPNSTTINVSFSSSLDPNIGISNVTVEGTTTSNLTIKSVTITSANLVIRTQPMVGSALYKLTFVSTTTQSFQDARTQSFLIEDGFANVVYYVGVKEDNEVRDQIFNGLPGVYDVDDTVLSDLIDSFAGEILTAKQSVGEVKSSNYVSIGVTDEELIRGNGPSDRFVNEGVFQITRVGKEITGADLTNTIIFSEFPSDPISLQQVEVTSEEISNTTNASNKFEGILLTVANGPIISISSIILTRGATDYTYDIDTYRYGILESKYDSTNAYSLSNLESNEIQLNNEGVGGLFPFPQGNDIIKVTYKYKNRGRVVEEDTVEIFNVENATREVAPSISNTFFLANAPIVDSNGVLETSDGVTWLDPSQNYDSTLDHPAFVREIAFSLSNLPSATGEYAVDYSTGRVYIYGSDGTGLDGSTSSPPVASYLYKKIYQNGLDYNFDIVNNDIAASSVRDLISSEATIEFNYEDTFSENQDFTFKSHVEITDERINNNLINTIGLRTINDPITEVFRIFNETTGEIYPVTRIDGREVYFSSVNEPKTVEIGRERVSFEQVVQDQMIIKSTLSPTGKSFNAFKVELSQALIGSATEDYVGAFFNSSLNFTDSSIFSRELFYNSSNTETVNLQTLSVVGDYIVNYRSGIVYVAVASGASTSIGFANYKYGKIKTKQDHILFVNNVYRSKDIRSSNVLNFTVGAITDTNVSFTTLEEVGEKVDSYGSPLVVVDGTTTTIDTVYDIHSLRHIYQVTDVGTNATPIDFFNNATFSDNTITLAAGGVFIEDSGPNNLGILVESDAGAPYVDAERISLLTSFIKLSTDTSLFSGTDIFGTDFFKLGTDALVDNINNRIYLPTAAAAAIGSRLELKYSVLLKNGANIIVDYTPGDIYIDYTYLFDEILITYEYGNNALDWGISDALESGETYYVTYRYGALRNSLRDNFGASTAVEELLNVPYDLDREVYRSGVNGVLQSYAKGPTIPAIKQLVNEFTKVDPIITESVFQEWILGRDHLSPLPAKSYGDLSYSPGKFGNGLLFSSEGDSLEIQTAKNMRFNEGTLECFVKPEWKGFESDADITFNISFDGYNNLNKIFIGSAANNPTSMPFTLNKESLLNYGLPFNFSTETGYFIWFDSLAERWRMRARAPIVEERRFEGTITTSGEFHNVMEATTKDGYDGYSPGLFAPINEANDFLTSGEDSIIFDFIVDGYDFLNMTYDSYSGYGNVGYDGIDFLSGKYHYIFDTGVEAGKHRLSLYKDSHGTLKFTTFDKDGRFRQLSGDVSDWERGSVHHVACSWKIGTVEERDEFHLFIDGRETRNTYKYGGYIAVPGTVTTTNDPAQFLVTNTTLPTTGSSTLNTVSGSNIVTDNNGTFTTSTFVGAKFLIIDSTADGIATQTRNIIVSQIDSDLQIRLTEVAVGAFNLSTSLNNVKYSLNPITTAIPIDPNIERTGVYVGEFTNDTELRPPTTTQFDYEFTLDGYQNNVVVYNGIPASVSGTNVFLYTYGLTTERVKEKTYVWGNKTSNLLKILSSPPSTVSQINITGIILDRLSIQDGYDSYNTFASGFDYNVSTTILESYNPFFGQPSNDVLGKKLDINIRGTNFDFSGVNSVKINGTTVDGVNTETINFTLLSTITTSKFWKTITDMFLTFTPRNKALPAGSIEIRENIPITREENNGEFASVTLSVIDQTGITGTMAIGTSKLVDAYGRFSESDIDKTVNITSPAAIAGTYTITDVDLDPSGAVKDSSSITLNIGAAAVSYSAINWKVLNTNYSESGFANGLITLEISGSAGQPYYLTKKWYEVNSPTYLIFPWDRNPEKLWIGSDMDKSNIFNGAIDELIIFDEMMLDTRRDETLPSSGRTITTNAQRLKKNSATTQMTGLFHFDDLLKNSATFYSSYSGSYFHSQNSINTLFGQSAVFNTKKALILDNTSIFSNDEGTIEFWVSPLLDTYNDPTNRYYVDITTEESVEVAAFTPLKIMLPLNARSIISVIPIGSTTDYFIGGSLDSNGVLINLEQALPANLRNVIVTYVPEDSTGDRFSIIKDEFSNLNLLVVAGGSEFQIRTSVFWKKNSWHRIHITWDLNNTDNQDTLRMLVDGVEGGIIRYGTGLLYGLVMYGQPTVWGQGLVGTSVSRNLLSDINLTDFFNKIYIGADFTEQFPAMAKIDNLRFSDSSRGVRLLGGTGPGSLLGYDFLYTSNVNTANPVVTDALTTYLADFTTTQEEVENIAITRDAGYGIFDFTVKVLDSFKFLENDPKARALVPDLIQRIKPAHTRAFVEFEEEE